MDEEAKKYSAEENALKIPCRIYLPSENKTLLVDLKGIPFPALTVDVIAHSLSTKARYNGHTPWPYSVALHSVLVSMLVQDHGKLALEALLHDAAEAFVGDVISPIKREIRPVFKPLEEMVDSQIRSFYLLPGQESAEVKQADTKALWLEQYFLQGREFTDQAKSELNTLDFELGQHVCCRPMSWEATRRMFEWHYSVIQHDLMS